MITKIFKRIDERKLFVENVPISFPENPGEALALGLDVDEVTGSFELPEVPSDLIEEEIPPGIIRPKWDDTRWIEGITPDLGAIGSPNWQKLQSTLRGSMVLGKAMATTNTNAWSLLLFALGTSNNVDDLSFALSQVRSGMSPDFDSDDLEFINDALKESWFDLRVS